MQMDFVELLHRVFKVLSLPVALASLSACASAPGQGAPYERELDTVVEAGRPDSAPPVDPAEDAGPCGRPATDCPCEVDEQAIECGTVYLRIGDYIRCSKSYRTCKNGVWGECLGDRIVGAP
jgi:hypothetical protein